MNKRRDFFVATGLLITSVMFFVVFAEQGLLFPILEDKYLQLKWELLAPFHELWIRFQLITDLEVILLLSSVGLFLWGVFYLAIERKSLWRRLQARLSDYRVQRARMKAGRNRLFIGHSLTSRRAIYLSNQQRTQHTLLLGSTGTGKTTSGLEPAIFSDMQAGRGLLMMTGKEEPDFIERVLAYAHYSGREKDVFLVTLSDVVESHSYNPLIYGDETALRDLCMEAFSWDNPYYRDQAKSALLFVLDAMKQSKLTFTLSDLYCAFTEKGCLELLWEMTGESQAKHHLNQYIQDWKTFRDNMRGLAANLEDYAGPRLSCRLCTPSPDLDLVSSFSQNRIMLFVLNSLQYGETARALGRMVLQNIKYVAGLSTLHGGKHFFPIYLDEFHHFIYPEFLALIAQCRSANLGLTLSTQSFEDLRGSDWDLTTQIVQNTNNKLILRQNDAEGADYAARLSGTQTVELMTDRVERSWWAGNEETGQASRRFAEEFVVHPNRIRTLSIGQAEFIVQGKADLVQLYPMKRLPLNFRLADYQKRSGVSSRQERLDLYERLQELRRQHQDKGIRRPQFRKSANS